MGIFCKKYFILLVVTLSIISSCVTQEEENNTPTSTFHTLWKILDQRYCFFQEKEKEFQLNWQNIYAKYFPQVHNNMSQYELFELCQNMVNELKDGHVNIVSSFNVSSYTSFYEDYPRNFSDSIQSIYLGKKGDYKTIAGIRYRILKGDVGYMYIKSFDIHINDGSLHQIMQYLAPCKALIIDVRNNPGGMLTSAKNLASILVNKKTTVGYIKHKLSAKHNDFSGYESVELNPSKGLRWQKKVVILTNRRVFSAANSFVSFVRYFPQVTIIGDHTGGGGGLPMSYDLPNGWLLRLSSSPMFDARYESMEKGIPPTYKVDFTSEDYQKGKDTLIEKAFDYIQKKDVY